MTAHDTYLKCLPLYQMTKFHQWSKLKSFADDNIHVTEKLKLVFERGKGGNADYHHDLFFPVISSWTRVVKS